MPLRLPQLLLLALARGGEAAAEPLVAPGSTVLSGCARFSVLTERLVRMERALPSTPKQFDDRATFAAINRKLPVPAFHVQRNATATVLRTAALSLTHRHSGGCSGAGFAAGEVLVELLVAPHTTWTSGGDVPADPKPSSVARIAPEPENLNGTMNHGPSFAGGLDCYSHPPDCYQAYTQVIGQGLLSRRGFAIVNDTNNTRLAPAPASGLQWFDPPSTRVANHRVSEDLYLLVSGLDYPRALGDWAAVGGGPSLPPLAALGIWYSRYYPYGEQSYTSQIIDEYKANALPLSVGVLDVR